MNNTKPFHNELFHYGVKGMKWGVRKTKNTRFARRKVTVQSYIAKAKFYTPPKLSPKEFGHVMHELSTNITAKQRSQPVIVRNIGDYTYVFENNFDNTFKIVHRRRIYGVNSKRTNKKT